jgi:hypothetical protein
VPVTLAVGRPASGIGLYADSPPDVAGSVPLEALLFPYHRWGNRTAGGMRVWIPTDAKTAP